MDAPGMFSFPKLDNQNWRWWSFRMKALLSYDNRWYVVHGTPPVPPTARWIDDDRKALATIVLSVDNDQFMFVRRADTAREAWEALRRFHEAPYSGAMLSRKFQNLKLAEGGNVHDHLTRLDDLFWRMEFSGVGIEDKFKIPMILATLPDSYGGVLKALEEVPEAEQTVLKVWSMIEREYQRQQWLAEEGAQGPLKVLRCHRCNQEGHKRKQCPKGQ